MQIVLQQAGKRFNRDWIFRKLSYTFQSGKSYAITGPNGSGKSTLLQVISGAVSASEGSIEYTFDGKKCSSDEIFKHVAIAAPYLELIEEMTAAEFLQFHQTFKPFIQQQNVQAILNTVGLQKSAEKQIRYFSSGMKQRLKLAQAIFSDVPVILLDEPCTNLDASGYELYNQLIGQYCNNRLIIVSSNDKNEYGFCSEVLQVTGYKP